MLINGPPHRIIFSLPPFPVIPEPLKFLGQAALLALFHRIFELPQEFHFLGIFLSHSEVNLRSMTEWLLTDVHIDTTFSHGLMLIVIHTPGHTSGSICTYEFKTKALFSGDTVFAGGTLSYITESGSVGGYINSITRLEARKILRIFPCHGDVSQNPEQDPSQAILNAKKLLRGEGSISASSYRPPKSLDAY